MKSVSGYVGHLGKGEKDFVMKGANNIWKSLFQSSVAIYRNHPIELLHKSVDHFLYNGNRDDKQNASDASDASASVVSAKKYFLKIVSALFG